MAQNEATTVDVNQLLLHAAAAGDLDLALAALDAYSTPICPPIPTQTAH